MKTFFDFLGVLAGILQVIGYIWYISYVVRGVIKPNTGSWLIWAYGNAIVCWNYILMGDITWKESLPIACSAFSFVSAIIFLFLKKFEKPTRLEVGLLIGDVILTVYWLISGDNHSTAIALQISVIISFVSIIRETKLEPGLERSGPWIVWSTAYLLLFVAELPEGPWKYVYPINYLIWHAVIAKIAPFSKPSSIQ